MSNQFWVQEIKNKKLSLIYYMKTTWNKLQKSLRYRNEELWEKGD